VIELISTLIFIVLAIIIIASTEYYKQIRKAQKEYEKSKTIIENIVLSFNRELKREATRLELVAYKVDGSLSKSETSIKRVESLEKIILPMKKQLNNFNEDTSNFVSKTSRIESLIQNIDNSSQTLKKRLERVEEKITKLTEIPEIKRETVIPIRREKAMSAITETEIRVLELISNEGGKTAPEIKNRINLSREHTARLMKKLYEKGYLERETGKIPFIYKIKEEMKKILNSTNNS
jgi:DNA-binding MarR family transcriptional regulator